MKMLKILSVFLFLVFLFSCKKDDDYEKQIKTDLLINKKWFILKSTISPPYPFNNGTTTNYRETWDECSYDDSYFYNNDGTAYIDHGKNICSGESDEKTYFTWTFNSDYTATIEIYENENAVTLPIIELSEGKWIYTYTFTSNEITYTVKEECFASN